MRKLIYILVACSICSVSLAQQINQYSQYMITKSLLNPAAAGIQGKFNADVGYRNQWSGFEGAPSSFFFAGNYVLGKHHKRRHYKDHAIRVSNPDLFKVHDTTSAFKHVIGAYTLNNITGPMNTTTAYGTYTYHIPIDEFQLSLGAAVGMGNLKLNVNEIEVEQQNDDLYQAYVNGNANTTYFDMSLGIMFYSHNFFIGYSANGIAPNKVQFGSESIDAQLNTHHYFSAGAKFPLGQNLYLKPSVLTRAVSGAPVSYDFNLLADYKDIFWLGATYRNKDAVIFMGGVTFNRHYLLAYSFDLTLSELKNYNSGTHEIILGIHL